MIKLGDMLNTEKSGYRKLWLCKWVPTGEYQVLALVWDEVNDVAKGWATVYGGTIAGARRFIKNW